jgi:hypothetical protein
MTSAFAATAQPADDESGALPVAHDHAEPRVGSERRSALVRSGSHPSIAAAAQAAGGQPEPSDTKRFTVATDGTRREAVSIRTPRRDQTETTARVHNPVPPTNTPPVAAVVAPPPPARSAWVPGLLLVIVVLLGALIVALISHRQPVPPVQVQTAPLPMTQPMPTQVPEGYPLWSLLAPVDGSTVDIARSIAGPRVVPVPAAWMQAVAASAACTIALWIELAPDAGSGVVVSLGRTAQSRNLAILRAADGAMAIRLRTTMTTPDGLRPALTGSAGSLPTGRQHLAIVRESGYVHAFLNGRLMASAAVGGTLATWDAQVDLSIGVDHGDQQALATTVSGLRLWDQALTPAQIRTLAGQP